MQHHKIDHPSNELNLKWTYNAIILNTSNWYMQSLVCYSFLQINELPESFPYPN